MTKEREPKEVTRGNTLGIRLADDEIAGLRAKAERVGLAPSELARQAIRWSIGFVSIFDGELPGKKERDAK